MQTTSQQQKIQTQFPKEHWKEYVDICVEAISEVSNDKALDTKAVKALFAVLVSGMCVLAADIGILDTQDLVPLMSELDKLEENIGS